MASIPRDNIKLEKPRRDFSALGIIDYSLMAFGTALAVWSAGMAIAQPQIGFFSAALVLVGTVISYAIRVLGRGSKLLLADAVLYPLAAIGAAVFAMPLQQLMPEQGFPRDLFAAAWLSWMLIFGSFFTWRDSTLLFQAVPAIAMFGLVGCYDTFRDVRFAFFGFLICLAAFFARAHGRQMLKEAADSGYFALGLAPGTPAPSPELTPGLMDRLRNGPWRWVAGPEWAVASALVVIVISLLGAPVIQTSMEGVTGFVRVNSPRVRQPSTIPQFVSATNSESVSIGRGPITLTEKTVLEIKMDEPRYLRASTYTTYNGGSWSTSGATTTNPSEDVVSTVLGMMTEYETIRFSARPQQRLRVPPIPGEPLQVSPGTSNRLRPDGTVEFGTAMGGYNGTSAIPNSRYRPVEAPDELPPILANVLSRSSTPSSVRLLAQNVTAGAQTDIEKAHAIKAEIERRIRYSINAPATPDGEDPVSFALFDSQVAYCDLFASSMVLMARSVGIPARYATGYLVQAENEMSPGQYVVQEKNAHAWAELLFEDVGWVIFDPTEGAFSLDGDGVGSSNSLPWYKKAWFRSVLEGSIVVVLLVGGLFAYRGYRHRILHPNHVGELENVYLGFTRLLYRASGVRRGIGTTAREYLATAKPHLGSLADEAEALNREFETAFYAPGVVDSSLVQKMSARLAEFRTALKQQSKK